MDVTQATLGQTIEGLTLKAVELARDRYGVTLDFSLNSLPQFGTLVDQAHQIYVTSSVSEQGLEHTIEVWGAYYGETVRRNKRGVWKLDPEQTGDRHIYLETQNVRVYPFEQVRQRITGQASMLPDRDMPPPPPEPDKPKNKAMLILLIAVGIFAVLGIIAILAIQQLKTSHNAEVASQRAAYEAQFQPYMASYLKEYPNPAGHDPALKGKVLVVNKNTGGISNLQYHLPEKLKAANPDELSVVAQYECQVVGSSKSSGSTIIDQLSCRLTLIDLANQEAGYQQDFTGSETHAENRVDEFGLPIDTVGGGLDPNQMAIWLEALIQ